MLNWWRGLGILQAKHFWRAPEPWVLLAVTAFTVAAAGTAQAFAYGSKGRKAASILATASATYLLALILRVGNILALTGTFTPSQY